MNLNQSDPAGIAEAQAAFDRGYAQHDAYLAALAATPGVGFAVDATPPVFETESWTPLPEGMNLPVATEPQAQYHAYDPQERPVTRPAPRYADFTAASYGMMSPAAEPDPVVAATACRWTLLDRLLGRAS